MELYDYIRKISFIFFVILGLAHFVAGLLYVNGYATQITLTVNRALFIPFVLTGLAYVFSGIKCKFNAKWLTFLFIGIAVAVFLGLIAIEIFVPDLKTPLLAP